MLVSMQKREWGYMTNIAAHGTKPAIVWFRADLRLGDNRALLAAAAAGKPVICLYILEKGGARRTHGAAQLWWLHHSLSRLASALTSIGGALCLRRGDAAAVIDKMIEESGADAVFWNRRHDPQGIAIDTTVKSGLKARGMKAVSFDGQLLHEPTQVKTGAGNPFKVYTPFWRAFSALPSPRAPYEAPDKILGFQGALAQ